MVDAGTCPSGVVYRPPSSAHGSGSRTEALQIAHDRWGMPTTETTAHPGVPTALLPVGMSPDDDTLSITGVWELPIQNLAGLFVDRTNHVLYIPDTPSDEITVVEGIHSEICGPGDLVVRIAG